MRRDRERKNPVLHTLRSAGTPNALCNYIPLRICLICSRSDQCQSLPKMQQQMVKKFVESKIRLLYQYPECDKYTFEHEAEVDCQSRRHLCKAVCCKFPFALSRQDVVEGVIRWEFGRPYLIAHGAVGYCVHLDRESYRCTV